MKGYTANTEKKYFDKTYIANSSESLTGVSTIPIETSKSNGVMYVSNGWGNYNFRGKSNQTAVSNDMLKGLQTGTTATTRIGNKVKINYVKGAFTFTAAAVGTFNTTSPNQSPNQGGEAVVGSSLIGAVEYDNIRYLRTSFRFAIVKDLQVNSTDLNVTWPMVFGGGSLSLTGVFGLHTELNIDNMGRFIVLEDKTFNLDADTPQKTLQFNVAGNRLGSVRYNGPGELAYTDKGLYVIWSAFVMGYNLEGDMIESGSIQLPSPVGHSRICFHDE